MGINRRAFLAWLGGTAAGVALAPTLDLDRLLWVPGEKTIFLPPVVEPVLTTGSALTVGDIFTISGVHGMHPIAGKPLAFLQQFVITANVSPGVVNVSQVFPRIDRPPSAIYPAPVVPRGSRVQPYLIGKTIARFSH